MTDLPALLAEAGISRPWLARMTGYSLGAVKRWCNGTAAPPAAILAWLTRRISDPPPALRRSTGTTE